MKHLILKWSLVVGSVLFALFIFFSGVVAASGQALALFQPVGNFLFDAFSIGAFLFPFVFLIAAYSLASKKIATKEGLLVTALFIPFVLLFSFWISLVMPRDVVFYNNLVETIQANHGSFAYTLYLSLFFLAVVLAFLAPVRIFLSVIDDKLDLTSKSKKPKPFQSIENYRNLADEESTSESSSSERFNFMKRLKENNQIRPVQEVQEEKIDNFNDNEETPYPSDSFAWNAPRLEEEADELVDITFNDDVDEEEEDKFFDFGNEKDVETTAENLLNDFPNVKKLFNIMKEEKEAETESQYNFDDLEAEEDPGFKMLEDAFLESEEELDYFDTNNIEDEEPFEESFEPTLFDNSAESFHAENEQSFEPEEPIRVSLAQQEQPKKIKTLSERQLSRMYKVPIDSTLDKHDNKGAWDVDPATRLKGVELEKVLAEFGVQAQVSGIKKGPVITLFEVVPAPGVKVSSIVNLQDNIALRLAAIRVRIFAPIPGKQAVGIEIPNAKRALVGFREIAEDKLFDDKSMRIPVILGKDIMGQAQIIDLAATPHMLIAGSTGSGKSVCVNSLVTSILFRKRPDEVKMIMVDPKVVELKLYNDIPHLLTPVITEPKRALQALQYCITEMDRRYNLLTTINVRDISSFNEKIKTQGIALEKLPYLVVIIDEFADLMATSSKELEGVVARLAAKSRAVGIHLVLATQRPSVGVITGIIKANIPTRIAFMVASAVDSKTILGYGGAERLLGKGDMLFAPAWDPSFSRIQGAFLTDEEVENVVEHVKTLGEPDYIDDEIFIDEEEGGVVGFADGGNDSLMNRAVEIVRTEKKASVSYLQRRLGIGFNRAARLVEAMEEQGIVGPANGSKPRDVFF